MDFDDRIEQVLKYYEHPLKETQAPLNDGLAS